MNHAEIIDMVSEGVRAALNEREPTEQVNYIDKTENLRIQIQEMRGLIEKMNNAQNQIQQQNQPFVPNPYMYHPQFQNQFQPQYQPNFNQKCSGHGNRFCGGQIGCNGRGNGGREPKYCWTHRLCGHNGGECSNPEQGHQQDSASENCMDGNMRNVNA